MSVIAKLKLVASKRERNLSPIIVRRNKLVAKIEEQLQLAKAQNEGRLYAPKRIKNVTNAEGERVAVETTKRVKEWYWTAERGKINLSVRYGSKLIELAKGKNAVEVADCNELVDALEVVKIAVLNGELDTAIENAAGKLREGFTK